MTYKTRRQRARSVCTLKWCPAILTTLILLTAVPVAVQGEDWPQWRGPLFNGSSAETNLPVRWSKTEGMAWVLALPGKSSATPIVSGDSIFLASADTNKDLRLLCVSRTTGAIRWQKVVGTGDRVIGKNNMASCSAVTDGKSVYALFGTSDFAAFDFDGKELWHRKLKEEFGAFAVQFLYGASPLLLDGKLYVALMQRNPPTYGHAADNKPDRQSWLICLDAKTGKTLWAQERKTDAPEEAMEAYTTPLPWYGAKGLELIVAGADCVTAHRPDSGQELWRYCGLNPKRNRGGRIVPSPVATQSTIFACGPKRELLVGLRGGSLDGQEDKRVAWMSREYVPDVCTPLLYQGRLFVLDGDRQMLTCFQPESGEKIWQGKLGVREIFYASPTGADGKIYCLSEEGTVVVASAGNAFEVLATIRMGEGPCGASIVPAGGCLLIRTSQNLYCVKGKRD
ncbi:MAG TPA: PQQ-binding-like beta-propeller repeat protein [Clostridia bacterium]|nr:PQQ-binding-like beta-propeller repeat protein [Clostridia bacterium]